MPMATTQRFPLLGRRQVLGTMGWAAAGSVLLDRSLDAADNPANLVSDRSSSIRITKLTPNICRDRVYVRIDTNLGIHGWGEIKGVIPSVAAALATSMFDLIDGQNPTRIEHVWQLLYRAERNQRGGAFMVHCIAGIDMALWDSASTLDERKRWLCLIA